MDIPAHSVEQILEHARIHGYVLLDRFDRELGERVIDWITPDMPPEEIIL